jgi:hypothetical protein
LRSEDPDWELSVDECKNIEKLTLESTYSGTSLLEVAGLGEPTLVSTLDEMLYYLATPFLSETRLLSNGFNLNGLSNVGNQLHREVTSFFISVYPKTDNQSKRMIYLYQQLVAQDNIKYINKYSFEDTKMELLSHWNRDESKPRPCQGFIINDYTIKNGLKFIKLAIPQEPAAIPCECLFEGPIITGGWYYPHCGMGVSVNVVEMEGVRRRLDENYLRDAMTMTGKMEACRFCQCNRNAYPEELPLVTP